MAVKFIDRRKKWFARHHVHINARLFVVPIGVVKGTLSPVSLSNAVLLARETRYRVGVLAVCRHMFSCFSENSDCGMRSKPEAKISVLRHPTLNNMIPIALPSSCSRSIRKALAGRVYQF